MRTFESVVSVLESLENYFDGKSVRMNLFLKGIRHSASFTGLGRKLKNFNSIPEDFYGFIDEAVCAGTTKNATYDDED
uniref:Uncharacterized protein n=1 Tax=Ditylenchus dipsaci TaxID=166011 RepID=A0A915E6W4_9BILA